MEEKSRVLVIGATGKLGRHLVEASLSAGHPTAALVRPTSFSDPRNSHLLHSFSLAGATLLQVHSLLLPSKCFLVFLFFFIFIILKSLLSLIWFLGRVLFRTCPVLLQQLSKWTWWSLLCHPSRSLRSRCLFKLSRKQEESRWFVQETLGRLLLFFIIYYLSI